MHILKSFLLIATLTPLLHSAHPRVINGTVVNPNDYKQVVDIRADGAGCTASIVGKKVLLTAAHCARTGSVATFKIDGKLYRATLTRNPKYPQQDYDISLGLVDQEIDNPYSIRTSKVEIGEKVRILGYGCTQPKGHDQPDGRLRLGTSTVTEYTTYDFVSENEGALCYGDSGGPTFTAVSGKYLVSGVNSKGDISSTSYFAALFAANNISFMKTWAAQNGVDICGVTAECSSGGGGGGGGDPDTFVMESSDVKLSVTRKPQSSHAVDYIRQQLQMVLDFLEGR